MTNISESVFFMFIAYFAEKSFVRPSVPSRRMSLFSFSESVGFATLILYF
jgi:hypothetical protein